MDPFHERVLRMYQDPRSWCDASRMAELAPGVVAVEDSWDEADVIFDLDRWQFKRPELWKPGVGMTPSPMLAELNLQVLPGLARFPPMKSIEEIVSLAQDQLVATGGGAWHPQPLPVNIPRVKVSRHKR